MLAQLKSLLAIQKSQPIYQDHDLVPYPDLSSTPEVLRAWTQCPWHVRSSQSRLALHWQKLLYCLRLPTIPTRLLSNPGKIKSEEILDLPARPPILYVGRFTYLRKEGQLKFRRAQSLSLLTYACTESRHFFLLMIHAFAVTIIQSTSLLCATHPFLPI